MTQDEIVQSAELEFPCAGRADLYWRLKRWWVRVEDDEDGANGWWKPTPQGEDVVFSRPSVTEGLLLRGGTVLRVLARAPLLLLFLAAIVYISFIEPRIAAKPNKV